MIRGLTSDTPHIFEPERDTTHFDEFLSRHTSNDCVEMQDETVRVKCFCLSTLQYQFLSLTKQKK